MVLERHPAGSRQVGIGVFGCELFCGAGDDESLVKQVLDGAALGSSVTKGVPRRNQFGVVFVELIVEPPERSPPLERLASPQCWGERSRS